MLEFQSRGQKDETETNDAGQKKEKVKRKKKKPWRVKRKTGTPCSKKKRTFRHKRRESVDMTMYPQKE
jgi:hypothetical protein